MLLVNRKIKKVNICRAFDKYILKRISLVSKIYCSTNSCNYVKYSINIYAWSILHYTLVNSVRRSVNCYALCTVLIINNLKIRIIPDYELTHTSESVLLKTMHLWKKLANNILYSTEMCTISRNNLNIISQ